LAFEIGSKLARIEAGAFDGCSALQSILIPRSIQVLRKGWAVRSSLRLVVFESGLSLQTMIVTGKVDLSEGFEIKFVDCDCALDFPGYSVQSDSGSDDLFHLVKKST
jgi:hypothetical protein